MFYGKAQTALASASFQVDLSDFGCDVCEQYSFSFRCRSDSFIY